MLSDEQVDQVIEFIKVIAKLSQAEHLGDGTVIDHKEVVTLCNGIRILVGKVPDG